MFKQLINKILKSSSLPAFVLMLILFIFNSITINNFYSLPSLTSLLNLTTPLICVAIGLSVVVLGGGLDISLGSIVCLTNVTFVFLIEKGIDLWLCILAAIGISLAIGIINGYVVGFLRVNSLIATFATSSIAGGLALWIMPRPSGTGSPAFVNWFAKGTFLGIPTSLYIIIVLLLIWLLVKLTPLGIYVYAVGRDEQKAYFSGISTKWVRFFTFIVSSLFTAVGALALTGNIGGGDPLVGLSLSLNAVAAVVLGGISLSGGKGNVLGSVFGAAFLGLIVQTVLGAKVPVLFQDMTSGLIIMFGIFGMTLISKWPGFNKTKTIR